MKYIAPRILVRWPSLTARAQGMEESRGNVSLSRTQSWSGKERSIRLYCYAGKKRDEKTHVYYANICVKIELCALMYLNLYGKYMAQHKIGNYISSRKVNLGTEGQNWKWNLFLALYHILLSEHCAFITASNIKNIKTWYHFH